MNEKDLLDYYWKYFELHSSQRMQLINFFITIEIVLIGGLFYLFSLATRMKWAEITTCIAVILIDITFMGLDKRTKELIHYSEECMKSIEEKFPSEYTGAFRIFQNAERKISSKKIRATYSLWFSIPFYGIIIIGVYLLYNSLFYV